MNKIGCDLFLSSLAWLHRSSITWRKFKIDIVLGGWRTLSVTFEALENVPFEMTNGHRVLCPDRPFFTHILTCLAQCKSLERGLWPDIMQLDIMISSRSWCWHCWGYVLRPLSTNCTLGLFLIDVLCLGHRKEVIMRQTLRNESFKTFSAHLTWWMCKSSTSSFCFDNTSWGHFILNFDVLIESFSRSLKTRSTDVFYMEILLPVLLSYFFISVSPFFPFLTLSPSSFLSISLFFFFLYPLLLFFHELQAWFSSIRVHSSKVLLFKCICLIMISETWSNFSIQSSISQCWGHTQITIIAIIALYGLEI